MIIRRSKHFTKAFDKLPKKIQEQFGDRLRLFLQNPSHSQLHIHPLKGELKGVYSINISGDYRAWFIVDSCENDKLIQFVKIGTHSELYG